jgi:hypothetical protein
MPLTEVPEHVRRFIVEAIDSVPELEALLLLRSHRDRTWSPEDAGARLYVSLPVATHVLSALAARGLLVTDAGAFRYAPGSADLETVIADLATSYSAHLIAVTRLIHGKPSPSVRQFADAFRLRKET